MPTSSAPHRPAPPDPTRLWPGLALAGALAGLAFGLCALSGIPALSPLVVAIILGMVVRNLVPAVSARMAPGPSVAPGLAFCLRRVLRAGIVLLGLQLTVQQIGAVGAAGVGILIACVIATFAFTTWLGRMLGVSRELTQLIAAGSSICGASAVIAANTVTRARDEDVAYAVACVTIFGSASMLLMPVAGTWIGLGAYRFGLWTGASIHEVAQVVAAAYTHGQTAGEFGTFSKLARVMMLAPVVIYMGARSAPSHTGASNPVPNAPHRTAPPVPWFVFGFIAMVCLASIGVVPAAVDGVARTVTQAMLAMALAAMGLETDLRKLMACGLRPAALGAGAWAFISVFSLTLIVLLT